MYKRIISIKKVVPGEGDNKDLCCNIVLKEHCTNTDHIKGLFMFGLTKTELIKLSKDLTNFIECNEERIDKNV